LRDYAEHVPGGALVVTDHGQPVAALVPVQNADAETVSLCTNDQFVALIERSRRRHKREGGISPAEMRRRLAASAPDRKPATRS
jgi:antitoxin (DNA-binding transcriptional repressor) of toxin-antitoxin stability system